MNTVQVNVNYKNVNDNLDAYFYLNAILLESISITTPPAKTAYRYGEVIDYAGMVITALYEGGGTADVTSLCSISPQSGKAFDPDYDSLVDIVYREGEDEQNCSFSLTGVTLQRLVISSQPDKTAYKLGEAISYSGIVVKAVYSDDSEEDVTSLCTYSANAGKAFDPDDDTYVEISYSEGENEVSTSLTLTYVSMSLQIVTPPAKTAYRPGEAIDYTGMIIKAIFSDETETVVTDNCTFTPVAGKAFDPDNDTDVVITYTEVRNGVSDTQTAEMQFTAVYLTGLAVTTNPTKTVYNAGEHISYTGIVVTATYSDGSTADVTNLCTFSPASGTTIDSDTTVTITYEEQICTMLLTVATASLVVDTMPTKTIYEAGETADYTGVVIKAVYFDGTEHTVTSYCNFDPADGETVAETVTVSCAPPAEPYVFDQNSGYIAAGAWIPEDPTDTFIDIYQVQAGHKYLLTLGPDVGTRFRAMFTTVDVSQATARVNGTNVINTNDPAAYASVEYIPSRNGFIAVGKDNIGKSGVKTYLYDANAADKSMTITFDLSIQELEYLAVTTNPTKMAYSAGETIDYTGIVVTATYSDGSTADVTSSCVFSPASGTTINTDTTVTISYGELSCTLLLTVAATMSLVVDTTPTKTTYAPSENADYTGAVIKAVHADGTTHTVTGYCDFDPADGETVAETVTVSCAYPKNPYLFDLNTGWINNGVWTYENPTQTYADVYQVQTGHKYLLAFGEDVGTRFRAMFTTTDVSQTTDTVTGTTVINVSNPAAYANVEYTAPSAGYIVVAKDNVGKSGISTYLYDANAVEKPVTTSFALALIGVESIAVTTNPSRMSYAEGETIDYTGLVVTATLSDGSTADVTSSCSITPAAGKSFDPDTDTNVVISYDTSTDTKTASLTLTEVTLSSLTITEYPTKMGYRSGETIDYSGIVIIATYSDGTKVDVAELCNFSPAAGTVFSSDITANITYFDKICSLNFVEAEDWYLAVRTMPEKTVFVGGENLDYTGLDIRAVYVDGTNLPVIRACELNPASGAPANADDMPVTVSCAKPIEPYIFDLTGGYVWNAMWIINTQYSYYNDIYQVTAGHKYFLTLGETVGNQFRVMFTTVDVSQASENVSGDYIAYNSSSAYANVEYTPPLDGYIVVYKNDNVAGIKTYLFDADAETMSLSIAFDFEIKEIDSIEIMSYPTKTVYYNGEPISYDGLMVVVVYTDGSREDITDRCTISPVAGKAFNPETDTQILISYDIPMGTSSLTFSVDFEVTPILLSSISVTSSPRVMAYKAGETIYYDNLVVIASYDDGSTKDVTRSCSITPAEGKAFDPSTDTDVLISYSERGTTGQITETASLTLTAIELTGIAVTQNPHKTAYSAGEPIDYAGLVVMASYSDGSTTDVTNLCSITPADGKAFDPGTDTDVEISYADQTTSLFLTEKYLTGIEVTHNPYRTTYKENEKISYDGMVVTASYSDGSTFVVTRKCRMTPASGKRFDPEEDTNVEITYANMTCYLMLTPVLLTGLEVTQNPAKMEYFAGEAIDYTGIVVSGLYSDGSKEDVTADCIFSPEAGTAFGSETDVTITYQEQTCGLTLTAANEARLIVSKLPEKTGYKKGDTISYKGTKVQAAYAGDGETAANYVGGIEIQASYADGTIHTVTDCCDFSPAEGTMINADTTVTVSCAEPMEPYAFDINNGYVDSYGTWTKSDGSSRSDVYQVTAGHRYLIAMGTAESFVYYVLFTTQDLTTTTSTVSGGTTLHRWSKDYYDEYGPQSYTPSSNGYLVITKSLSSVAGIKTYLYDANSLNKTLTTSFYLTVGELAFISATQPVKARYRVGEAFDYTGVLVSAKFTDGHIENVTEDALFSPSNGTIATSDSPTQQVYTQVTVGYHDKYACFHMLTTGGYAMAYLRVDTPPNKTYYYPGEKLDYTGLTVTAVYWDGSTKDVTHLVTFNPKNGTSPGTYRSLEGNTQVVTISYEETDETAVSNIGWAERIARYDVGVDFDDFDSYDSFSHGWVDTYEVSYFDIAAGETRTLTWTLYHTDALECFDDPEVLRDALLTPENIEHMKDYQREENEWLAEHGYETRWFLVNETVYTYWGARIKGRQFVYETRSYVTYREETNNHFIYPISEGYRGYLPPAISFTPLLQVSYGADASYDINLSVFGLESLVVTKMPTKTVYSYDEYIDTTGWEVTAYYTDGTTVDATANTRLTDDFRRSLGDSRQSKYYDSKKKGYNVQIEYQNSKTIVDGKEVYIDGARTVTGSFFISCS